MNKFVWFLYLYNDSNWIKFNIYEKFIVNIYMTFNDVSTLITIAEQSININNKNVTRDNVYKKNK